ncbi:MAG TPA: response regulator [Bacteroidales bacterium]|nr:response regulator [Bacteroidales bacterium]
MDTESENKNYQGTLSKHGDIVYDSATKEFERFLLFSSGCLLASLVLLTFDFKLIAGVLIIAAASLIILGLKKASYTASKYREALDEAEKVTEKQNEVITSFSHKIREPLNNLVIVTDMLIESGIPKKQLELLETFIASTNNMVTTVNELSMHSAGNLGYELRKSIRFNLISTLENTFDLYSLKDKANLEFILNKKELKDPEFFGDPIILKQIFLDIFNIIENKASEKAITVTINLKKARETSNNVTIAFRIQVDRNVTIIEESETSISLAKRLISLSGGEYEQELGSNHTILNISLSFNKPVAEVKQQPVSTKMEELTQREKVKKELKDLKILLVEDNLINQKITMLTLSPFVGSIDTASNGKEALDKFGTSNYDLILMDIQMPVMSGLTAAEKMRALESSTNSHVPIIAITANAMIGDKEKCLAVGIDDYISKPFQPASLVEKIKKVI